MSETWSHAFGAPGIAPTRSSSDKDFVTAALDGSRLWATIGHGIVNEVYWPSTGQPQIRDLSFYLVGNGHWIDLKRARCYRLLTQGPALPRRPRLRVSIAAPSPGASTPYLPGELRGLGPSGR
jgi:glucoamylase